MTILNTTFFADDTMAQHLRLWLEQTYIPAARQAGIFTHIEAAHVTEPVEPGVKNIAVRCAGADLEQARQWHDNTAAEIRNSLAAQCGQHVVWFTTYLETI